jgi:hypothetical protein
MLYNTDSRFARLTLIREKLTGTNTPERSPLTIDHLLGQWQGEAMTIYPDLRPSDLYSTRLQVNRLDNNRLEQQLTFGDRFDSYHRRLHFTFCSKRSPRTDFTPARWRVV